MFWFDAVGVVGCVVAGEGIDIDESVEDAWIVADEFCYYFLALFMPRFLGIVKMSNCRLLTHVQ